MDPPALPDTPTFVPPAVTLPTTPPEHPLQSLQTALQQAPIVQLPPPEAQPRLVEPPAPSERPRPRGRQGDPITQAEHGSLLTASRASFAENTSAILRYPYKTGAVYEILTSPAHATTLLLPPGIRLAAPPVLDSEAFDVGFAEMNGDSAERQEAIMLRATVPGLEVTTPLLTTSGHLFLLRIKSREQKAMLAVTWELPLVKVLTTGTKVSAASSNTLGSPTIDLARLHTQYAMEPGPQPVAWAPVEVYDDAHVTVVRFQEDLGYTAAPVLMAGTSDSKKTVPLEYVAYQVPGHPEKGLFYVTKGIYPRLRLLDGQHGRVDIVRLPTPPPAYVEQSHATR
jgi:type IV secretory pathway VirB9-like protein